MRTLLCGLIFVGSLISMCACIAVQGQVKGVYIGYEAITWSNITGSIVQDPVSTGFNVIILNFFAQYDKQGFDAMEAWKLVDLDSRKATVDWAHTQGAVILGGVKLSTPYGDPYTQNATKLGLDFGNWAVQYNLDGLDVNFQDINSGFVVASGINLTTWALDLLTAAYSVLGSDRILSVSASPVSFGPEGNADTYAGVSGGLLGVYKAIPAYIDYLILWYLVQPAACVANYNVLFASTAGTTCNTQTAVNELIQAGAPIDKTIVGIASQNAAETGYVDPTSFGSFVRTANTSLGWNAGVVTWNWQGTPYMKTWITSVFPPPVEPTTTSGSTTTAASTTSSSTTTTTGDVSTTTTTGIAPAVSTTTTTTTTAAAATTTSGSTTTTSTTGTRVTTTTTTTTTSRGTTTTTSSRSTSTTNGSAHVAVGYAVGLMSVVLCAVMVM